VHERVLCHAVVVQCDKVGAAAPVLALVLVLVVAVSMYGAGFVGDVVGAVGGVVSALTL
jgi:hypothetical protein